MCSERRHIRHSQSAAVVCIRMQVPACCVTCGGFHRRQSHQTTWLLEWTPRLLQQVDDLDDTLKHPAHAAAAHVHVSVLPQQHMHVLPSTLTGNACWNTQYRHCGTAGLLQMRLHAVQHRPTLMPCLRSSWLTVVAPDAPEKRCCHTCRPSPVQSTTRPAGRPHTHAAAAAQHNTAESGEALTLQGLLGHRLQYWHVWWSMWRRRGLENLHARSVHTHTYTLRVYDTQHANSRGSCCCCCPWPCCCSISLTSQWLTSSTAGPL